MVQPIHRQKALPRLVNGGEFFILYKLKPRRVGWIIHRILEAIGLFQVAPFLRIWVEEWVLPKNSSCYIAISVE